MIAPLTLHRARGAFALRVARPARTHPVGTVLCLHGFPDTAATFDPLLDTLADAGFAAAAPTLRGYRPSPVTGPFDLDTLADDALDLAAALSPDGPVHLVGHDWGAVITYVASARAPERVRAAVAMSVPHPAVFVRALATPAQLARSWYMLAFQLPGAPGFAAAGEFALIDRLWRAWSPGYQLPAALRRELHATLSASWPAPLLYYRAMTRPLRPALERLRRRDRITVPTLYLHGAADGCIDADAGAGAERFFGRDYRRDVIPGAGHFLAAEAPAAVAARVVAWLDAHRGSAR